MNILLLNYEYPPLGGGGAKVTNELCEVLSKHGNHVDVVTMAYKGLPKSEINDNIHIHRVKCWRKSKRVCHPWEQLSYCFRAYKYIKKNLDIKDYDLIHCHFIIPTGLLAYKLKRKYGIKYIITAHGSDVLGHNNDRFALLYKLIKPKWLKILRYADAVTAPSPYLVNKIHDNAPQIEVSLIPNGIFTEQYRPKEKKKSIITLTRLQESKGVQDLIEACSKIDLNGWKINILGDGPYRSELEKMTRELRLDDHIHFHGHVEGEVRMRFLSEAGAFFSGSRFEAFSLSVLEASLCGCNVVASKIEPHILLVGDMHTYDDQGHLINMLNSIVKKEPEIITYNNEMYDWENVYHLFNERYQKVIDE